MSIFEKKEKNLNGLIDKLNALTSTYSHSSYETHKIKTEKNELLRQKSEIEKKNQELMREHKYLKEKILGVNRLILERNCAVSEETAEEMAQNILKKTGADLGLSVTGIAGPGGGSDEKPVGTVFIGVADKNNTLVTKRNFINDREINKLKTSQLALNELRMRIV